MEELKNIKVALLGSGTVGTGVYKLIERQREELPHKVGAGLTVSKVLVRDKNKKREGIDPSVLTDQWEDIITDDEIQIVVEVMGGIEPARTYITEALQAGENVVTANKDLMAVHGGELLDIASHNGCDLLFEASVAGGIPIINGINENLTANKINELYGIVNGTTNYILSKMELENLEFNEEIKQKMAQKVLNMGTEIIKGKGKTYYGIATCVCHIADAILNRRNITASVSSNMAGNVLNKDISISLPSLINYNGVKLILPSELSETEKNLLNNSALQIEKTLNAITNM